VALEARSPEILPSVGAVPAHVAGRFRNAIGYQQSSSGQFFVFEGRETDTSFAVKIDLDTVEMLKETEPETYWQSKHYQGYPAVLVRYDSPDPERVRRVIEQAREQAAAKKPVRPRKKK